MAESLQKEPDLTRLSKGYREDVLSRVRGFLVENGISTPEQLKTLKLRGEVARLSSKIEEKKTTLERMDDGKTVVPAVLKLRAEIYNDLEPRFRALKLLHDWIYRH